MVEMIEDSYGGILADVVLRWLEAVAELNTTRCHRMLIIYPLIGILDNEC